MGLLLALLALARRLRLMALARRIRLGRVGRVEDGNIVFADGELPARGPLRHALPDGPAVAFPLVPPGHASYRDDGNKGAWTATEGARSEQLEAVRHSVMGADAFAFAVLLTSITPLLVVARYSGLF